MRYCVPSSTGISRLDTGQTQKTISHLWRVMKVDGTAFLGLLSRSDSRSVPERKPTPKPGKQTRPGPLGEAIRPFPNLWPLQISCRPERSRGASRTLPPVSILDYTRNDRFDATSKARETHPPSGLCTPRVIARHEVPRQSPPEMVQTPEGREYPSPLRSLRAPQGAWQTPEGRENLETGGKE